MTIRRLPASRPGAIATSMSSASAPTAATWRPLIFPGFALTVWDIDRRTVAVDDPGPVSLGSARFSPDSRRIAVVHRGWRVLDLRPGDAVGPTVAGLARRSGNLAFRPDGAQIAVIYMTGEDTDLPDS